MTDGIIAAVHRLTVEYVSSGRREFVVLRQYEHHGAVDREAAILRQAAGAGLPAPRLLAASAAGNEAGGHPSVLMTRLPGRADLCALATYNDSWLQFIPVQVNGRARVDVAGMTGRVEELLQATLRRL
jgi:Phosphotransferase enzyme family